MKKYLKETKILDYNHAFIQKIINERYWSDFDTVLRIKAIYNYVRDEIKFSYKRSDLLISSQILLNGYGDGNVKSILLMSLLRSVGIPCRLHGFIIKKCEAEGIIKKVWHKLSPSRLLHCWAEVYVNGEWYVLEGVMLDREYLKGLQQLYGDTIDGGLHCGFGICVDNLKGLNIDWELNDTDFLRKEVMEDLGVFESPDKFYSNNLQPINIVNKFFFENVVQRKMNNTIIKIRSQAEDNE